MGPSLEAGGPRAHLNRRQRPASAAVHRARAMGAHAARDACGVRPRGIPTARAPGRREGDARARGARARRAARGGARSWSRRNALAPAVRAAQRADARVQRHGVGRAGGTRPCGVRSAHATRQGTARATRARAARELVERERGRSCAAPGWGALVAHVRARAGACRQDGPAAFDGKCAAAEPVALVGRPPSTSDPSGASDP